MTAAALRDSPLRRASAGNSTNEKPVAAFSTTTTGTTTATGGGGAENTPHVNPFLVESAELPPGTSTTDASSTTTIPSLDAHQVGTTIPPNEATKQTLGLWSLVALSHFSVSGGPIGIEPTIAAGGPLGALTMVLVMPLVWGLPMALITAELATMIPEMGGAVVWVERAFGPFWAFQNGIWKVACNLVDNALYPNLFLYYLMDLTGDLNYVTRVLVSYVLVLFVVGCNVLGIDVVSDAASVFVVITLLPFLVMVCLGIARGGVAPSDWVRMREDGQPVELGTLFTLVLWKTSGFDNVGSCAAEVKNPGKTFPRAMFITVALVTTVYLLPVAVGVSYARDFSLWTDGYFVQVAEFIGEDWLAVWVTVTGSVTALAMLNATLATSARAIQSMAALGFFPKRLARIHPRFKTPATAVVLNGFIVMLLLLPDVDFSAIANVSMFFYSLTIVALALAFVKLRKSAPFLARPYKVPLSLVPLGLFVAGPPCVCAALLVSFSSLATWIVSLTFVFLTMAAWFPFRRFVDRTLAL